MKILVTGCLGFIGSAFVRYVIKNTEDTVIGLNRTTSEKRKRCVPTIDNLRFQLVTKDLTEDISGVAMGVDAIVNFAAKTFVDHSIRDPIAFIQNNIMGTYNLLEEARRCNVKRFIQISTDEVYGSILQGSYKEDSRLNPTNPYSATKAAADMLCISYMNTYKMPIIITRTENNFGEYQAPEKAIPTFIRKALHDEPLPVYGDGKHSRMWLHVDDHCSAILTLLTRGQVGEIYHVAGEHELQNLDLAKKILHLLGKPESLIEFVPDQNIRPGHDRRYALDSSKMRALGWRSTPFEAALQDTVEWYKANQWWFN